jgi:PAS domain S-box-containing protein
MGAELRIDAAERTPDILRFCRYLSERSSQPMVVVEGTTHIVSYLNPAFARLVQRERKDLIGRPFAEAVPEGAENECLALLDRVFRTGTPENLAEQEHRQAQPRTVYWSYAVWAVLGADERPTGVMVQVTDSTETALFRREAAAMNQALLVSGTRQHELAAAAESLNDQLEGRVAERTAELAAANASLRAEIGMREVAEADRRELLRLLGTAQEDERRRLARDLHDQMGQHLTALGLGLKVVKDATPDPSPSRDRLQGLQALTDLIGREIHNLALELRPTALDDHGLESALSNYAEGWAERSGIEVDFHGIGLEGDRLPSQVETALYRVVQEALTNVLKHAAARRVSVVIQRAKGQVTAVIEDDGRGFDADSITGSDDRRLGLLGMRERVGLLGGSLTIEPGANRGTTVIARVPLPVGDSEVRDA